MNPKYVIEVLRQLRLFRSFFGSSSVRLPCRRIFPAFRLPGFREKSSSSKLSFIVRGASAIRCSIKSILCPSKELYTLTMKHIRNLILPFFFLQAVSAARRRFSRFRAGGLLPEISVGCVLFLFLFFFVVVVVVR